MVRKVKRFMRRWKLCCYSPYVIKPKALTWTANDAIATQQFLHSDSGLKLLTTIDDVVFNAVMKGGNTTELVNGMIDMKDYIIRLGSPDVNMINPRLDEDEWQVED